MVLDKLNELSESHGALRPGRGMVTGVVALILAVLCFLGVLAFHFPEYLTTPQLRKSYDVETMRKVLLGAMVISGGLSLVNIVFNRRRWLAACACRGQSEAICSSLPPSVIRTGRAPTTPHPISCLPVSMQSMAPPTSSTAPGLRAAGTPRHRACLRAGSTRPVNPISCATSSCDPRLVRSFSIGRSVRTASWPSFVPP